jgi:small-conductance mechanosensitive channel
MSAVFDYLGANWRTVVIPVAVFAVSLIATFWFRKIALDATERRLKKARVTYDELLVSALKAPFSILCLVFSAYLGLTVSTVPANWKNIASDSLWTLFVIAMALALLNLSRSLTLFYGRKLNVRIRAIALTRNVIIIVILVVAVLVILEVWGVPISALLLFIAVAALFLLVGLRDVLPNLFASFQLAAGQDIKVGDYVRLDDKEEGYITQISWNKTHLRSLDGSAVVIPNSHLLNRKVVNYGRPLKKAKDPFYFNTRTHLAELTGLKATNLTELVAILKKVPSSVIYYHTHHFLEELQYLVPQLSNDFANWVNDSLGNEKLAERLASINTFDLGSLDKLKEKLIEIIEQYLAAEPDNRSAAPGREFYFIKSISVILPTVYQAGDLREFVEALRKISPGSLYFHIVESRLRLGQESNDFSMWLEKSMEESELARDVARIDPYTYSLEGLRSLLVQTIEKHIK